MSVDVSSIVPPDNSGSTTFERYCYQAHIAFPYCLNCALGGDVVSVVLEHLEDVAVEFNTGWRFLQIKTRDLERGPWRLVDLTGKSGALRSALRTHRVLGSLPATIEIHVEGVVDRKDLVQRLLTVDGHKDLSLVATVQQQLRVADTECETLLARVRLVHSHPTRDTIEAQNLRLLINHAGHLPSGSLESIYDQFLALVFAAMQAKALPATWKQTFLAQGTLQGKAQTTFLQKRLVKQHFGAVVGPLTTPPQPLLKRIIDGREQIPTLLEQKLIMGGASPEIIELAKMLRANASQREYEVLASQMYGDGVLEDLQTRLLIRAHGLVNQYGSGKAPAAAIWNQLLQVLSQQCHTIDSRGAFVHDPDMLLGEVCHLSDQCRTGWGIADA